jgi:hypothetical protein
MILINLRKHILPTDVLLLHPLKFFGFLSIHGIPSPEAESEKFPVLPTGSIV